MYSEIVNAKTPTLLSAMTSLIPPPFSGLGTTNLHYPSIFECTQKLSTTEYKTYHVVRVWLVVRVAIIAS